MAQFRATIKGTRGEASRLGSKSSGIRARVNGWNVGVEVSAHHVNGKDGFILYALGGSNAARPARIIGYVDSEGNFAPKLGD